MKTKGLSSFSVVLVMGGLIIIGLSLIPFLSMQYLPQIHSSNINVSCFWSGASANVMEAEVTSKIEGVLSSISGVEEVNSVSKFENCEVSIRLKKGLELEAIRFEISSKLRAIYRQLPYGVSYPYIAMGSTTNLQSPILTYSINANKTANEIKKEIESKVIRALADAKGVKNVFLFGDIPLEWVIYFDVDKCNKYNVTPNKISSAIKSNQGSFPLGISKLLFNTSPISVRFFSRELMPEQWVNIEIESNDGHRIKLGDVATVVRQEELPTTYHRVNGLNNIILQIYSEEDYNQIKLSSSLRSLMHNLEETLSEELHVLLIEDSAQYMLAELTKVAYRTGLSVLILLVFVFMYSRNMRYLLLIVTSLVANISLSFILYYLFDLEIHMYSLAGITVSLGMIIDTSIIMVDHFARFKNKKVFLAMLAATLTTIGALSIVYFLPDGQRQNLVDFSLVIILNLVVSLLIASLFIPALVTQFPLQLQKRNSSYLKGKRKIIKWNIFYFRFLKLVRRRKWVTFLILLLAFGIPIHLMPGSLEQEKEDTVFEIKCKNMYNSIFAKPVFRYKIKKWMEYTMGGSFRIFSQNIFSKYKSSDFQRTSLYLEGAMPDGCTVEQLNSSFIEIEHFLSQLKGVDVFRTYISSYDYGIIKITFQKKFENLDYVEDVRALMLEKSLAIGGVKWKIFGGGNYYRNSYNIEDRRNAISLCGYDYKQLYSLAESLGDSLKQDLRVSKVIVAAHPYEMNNKVEYYMNTDPYCLTLYDMPLYSYFSLLQPLFYDSYMGAYLSDGVIEKIALRTSPSTSFDAWRLNNELIEIRGKQLKLSQLGVLEKRNTGNNVYKKNQQYLLALGYDYLGSEKASNEFHYKATERIKQILPVGYRVDESKVLFFEQDQSLSFLLLILVAAIIYFICSILFESFVQPLVILTLIPVSFIGVFLVFSWFSIPFDEGGFASFVLLSGIQVNAGIYLVNEYNQMMINGIKSGLDTYMRCFNRKIIPISLTILSTALGLIPFLIVYREPFWYSFAVGSIGGLLFSFFALMWVLPTFLPLGVKLRRI